MYIGKTTAGINLHSFLFRWTTEILSRGLILGRYLVVTGNESKMQYICKSIGGFDKI